MAEKVTYASLKLTEEDHRHYDHAVVTVPFGLLSETCFPLVPQPSYSDRCTVNTNPSVHAQKTSAYAEATEVDIETAVRNACMAARNLETFGWIHRAKILQRAKELTLGRKFTIAAVLTHEAGKNRAEALAEVNEVAAMIDMYVDFAEKQDWYAYSLSNETHTYQRPLGGPVAVIAPFNFPFALSANMSIAAFLAGNPVILKPSEETPLSSLLWRNILVEAGAPEDAYLYLPGRGETVGAALNAHPDVKAIAFTGSLETGRLIMDMHASLSRKGVFRANPVMEMGGKNPVIVTEHADLDKAAEGIIRAVVGYSGQKCSATSRVYAHRSVRNQLLERLLDMARFGFPATGQKIEVNHPHLRSAYTGPVVSQAAVKRYEEITAYIRSNPTASMFPLCDDESVVRVEHELCHYGNFVVPLVITGIGHDHWINKREHFLPVVTLLPYDSLDGAIAYANDTEYGLCAGIFSEDREEIALATKQLEAGMVYVNRAAGATTGAWPGVQSFGGWKGSGSSGRQSFGRSYVLNFTREQCVTVEG